ncbi:GNAT family N-acetyltransferase [Pseudooceanicola algae]|nr:GNAT family N-acetyltransferase [Pseudooceanicola algae]
MKHVAPEAFPDDRMHRHFYYAKALAKLGSETTLMPDGTFGVRRRFGPTAVLWLPAPREVPVLRGRRGVTILQAPDRDMDRALRRSGAIPVLTPQSHAVLDISLSQDKREAGFAQKWRNRLNRARRSDLQVTHAPFPRDLDHWLLRREAEQRKARGYRALPSGFAIAWPQTRLFTAYAEGQPVAAMLFLLHAPGASYHMGWSGTTGRACSAHNLLLAEAAEWLHRRGHARLDLGTLQPRRAPGLAHFKLGSGAQVETSGHAWIHSRATSLLGCLIA